MGLLRFYRVRRGQITCYYSSLKKVAAAAGLSDLGPIAEINVFDLQYYRIISTQLEAEDLQRKSFYAALADTPERKKSLRRFIRKIQSDCSYHQLLKMRDMGIDSQDFQKLEDSASLPAANKFPPVRPQSLFFETPCDIPARVLGSNQRFLFVSEGFAGYGGSIAEIAASRNLHPSSVGRHLNNAYRLSKTPVRNLSRTSYQPLHKYQIAYRLRRGFSPLSGRCSLSRGKFLKIGDRYFEAGCNIYLPEYRLISYRSGRRKYKRFLLKFFRLPQNS